MTSIKPGVEGGGTKELDAERLLREARSEVREEIGADLKATLKELYRKESKAKQVLNGIRHEIEMAEHELKEKILNLNN